VKASAVASSTDMGVGCDRRPFSALVLGGRGCLAFRRGRFVHVLANLFLCLAKPDTTRDKYRIGMLLKGLHHTRNANGRGLFRHNETATKSE
jgi:hypothetical protein